MASLILVYDKVQVAGEADIRSDEGAEGGVFRLDECSILSITQGGSRRETHTPAGQHRLTAADYDTRNGEDEPDPDPNRKGKGANSDAVECGFNADKTADEKGATIPTGRSEEVGIDFEDGQDTHGQIDADVAWKHMKQLVVVVEQRADEIGEDSDVVRKEGQEGMVVLQIPVRGLEALVRAVGSASDFKVTQGTPFRGVGAAETGCRVAPDVAGHQGRCTRGFTEVSEQTAILRGLARVAGRFLTTTPVRFSQALGVALAIGRTG